MSGSVTSSYYMKGSFSRRAVCGDTDLFSDLFKSNGSKKSGCAYVISAIPDSLSTVVKSLHTLAGKWLYLRSMDYNLQVLRYTFLFLRFLCSKTNKFWPCFLLTMLRV